MKNDFTYWLRWIAVLPGALAAALLVIFPLHWLLYLAFAHNGTLLGFIELSDGANVGIEHTVTPFVIALTFILVGYRIAPQYKLKTSIVLTVLYVASFAGVFMFMPGQDHLQIRGILAILGSLLGLYIAKRKSESEETTGHWFAKALNYATTKEETPKDV